MIVALRALNGQPENTLADAIHAVEQSFHAELLGIDAAFLVQHRIAQKSGGDPIVLSGMRQLIAGDLFDDEAVVGQVTVERMNDPVAIRPDETRLVLFKSVRVGVTRGVEPMAPPTLAVMRRIQQTPDLFFVSIRGLVREERVYFRN